MTVCNENKLKFIFVNVGKWHKYYYTTANNNNYIIIIIIIIIIINSSTLHIATILKGEQSRLI
jgi:hypothetical protein